MKYKFIILLIILSSCASQRMNRILRNHPELIENKTITIHDSVKYESKGIDFTGSFPFTNFRDTVIFLDIDSMVVVRLTKNDFGDSLNVAVNQKPKTIYIPYDRKIEVPTICQHKPRDKLHWIWLLISVLLNILFVVLLFKK